MTRLLHWFAGYVLDFFRQRVDADDFRGETIARVLLAPGLDETGTAAIRRLFPRAEFHPVQPGAHIPALRRLQPDVVAIPMSGGSVRDRLVCLFGGARHTLFLPSPDYIYRLGLHRGFWALVWAIVDRLLLWPLALLWLGLLALLVWITGLTRRAAAAERGGSPWRPKRLLVIRLMPTPAFLSLLERVRRLSPDVHITALLASGEGRDAIREAADEVITSRDEGLQALLRRLRRRRFDSVVLAGGADYGLRPSYLKAALLARLTRARARYQCEVGEPLPGASLSAGLRRAVVARRSDGPPRPGPLGRLLLRRRYERDPDRGPTVAQIGLTKACNYHCLFCPFHSPTSDKGHRDADLPRMSLDTFARLLHDLKSLGTASLDVCGDGEPLMHPQAMDMIALARDLEFDVTLATNAALLTEARAHRLVDLGVRRMHVSFNAATDDVYEQLHPGAPPGTRRRIIDRLREMAEYADREGLRPIEVEFSAVLNRLNMGQIPQMVEAAREARAGWFMLILMGPAEGAEEFLPRPQDWIIIQSDLDRAAERARKSGLQTNLDAIRPGAGVTGTRGVYDIVPCYIGHEYALITADGNVMFCCQCSQPLGNLSEGGFREIWRSETYRRARCQARDLPRTKEYLEGCECFTACSHVAVNLEVYRRLRGGGALRSAGIEG